MLALALSGPPAAAQDVTTLAELIKRHDSSSCEGCHDTIHREGKSSYHARSIVQSLGSFRAYVAALENERKVAPDKTQMLKCLDCHAPMVNDGNEAVMQEIVALVKTATDDKDEAKKKAAVATLAALRVNCTGCHTVKGTGNPLATPKPDVRYGTSGNPAPHPTMASPVMQSSVDLSLQPRQTATERLTVPLPDGTQSVEIEAVLTYHHRPGEEFVVHRAVRRVPFR